LQEETQLFAVAAAVSSLQAPTTSGENAASASPIPALFEIFIVVLLRDDPLLGYLSPEGWVADHPALPASERD
jgi:hypothetical protein